MIYNDIIYGGVELERIEIDPVELSARLGIKRESESIDISNAMQTFSHSASYRFAYVKVPVSVNKGVCDFSFASVESDSLAKVLSASSEAIILAVSAGINLDRQISRLHIKKSADAYILDAIGSAAVESLADYINAEICNGLNTTKRFSPGYADFPLSFQKDLLERLNAQKTVGISLNDKLLMIPMKSITAVIGVK